MKEIVIIGGGASGLFASIVLKQELQDDVKVTIVERLERVGKKILSTGSGKANFTNEGCKGSKYNNPKFVSRFLREFGVKQTLEFFEKLGLKSTKLTEGRCYPKSESASSLLDVLRNNLKELNIEEKCNFEVKRITNLHNKYIIESTRGIRINADFVILATGGKASPVLGSNGSGYNLAKILKIKVTDIEPGLVGIKTDAQIIKGLEGLRVKAKVSLFVKKQKVAYWRSSGEVLFKQDSVSGIVIMDMGSIIARGLINKTYHATHFSLDLYPDLTYEELVDDLMSRKENLVNYSNANFLIGIFHKMLALNIIKKARVDVAGYVKDLSKKDIERIAKEIKEFVIPIKSLDNYDHAQVCVGGVDVDEVIPETLESRKNPGVYIIGELLDIDGDCGGYNLQWAWSSAYVCGKAIATRVKNESIGEGYNE